MEATPNKSTTAQDGWDGAANFAWTSPDDDFEVWLAERLDFKLSDPSFEVRRALPADFDAIFDLVDVTFGTRRPRAQYHWLYQDNPLGLAHCWLLFHRERRRLVGATAYWPWPLALGSEVLPGVLGGDGVIATEWQRQGVFNLIREGFRSHSEYERRAMVSWPNVKNQGRQKKHGLSFRVIGPLPQARWNLRRGLLDRLTPQRRPETVVIDRFDSTFDTLTWRWMGSDGFWSPHDSEFLNWRYLRHPVREYGAFAVLGPKGDAIGYCVVGLDGDEAHPVEMTAPFEATAYRALLNRASRMAQEAGARRMRFFATPSWPGWPLLRELGFLDRPSDRCLMVRSVEVGGPDHFDLDAWQLLPGDDDTI